MPSKMQTESNVKVVQDVLVRSADNCTSKVHSPSKKRRITSSMLYLEEEPVFSDSEEENDFTLRIFGKPKLISPPKSKYCDVEIQCDIISEEKTLFGLIKKCSTINSGTMTRYKHLAELVSICKLIDSEISKSSHIQDEHHEDDVDFQRADGAESIFQVKQATEIVPTAGLPQELLPSSCGKFPGERNSFLYESFHCKEMAPSGAASGDEICQNKPKIRKSTIRLRKKQENIIRRHSLRESKPPKHKYPNSLLSGGTKLSKLLGKNNQNQKENSIKRKKIIEKPKESSGSVDVMAHQDLIHSIDGFTMNTDVHFKMPLPKRILKPLARNWMNPNKSFSLNETIKPKPHYASLQQEKRRYLYSPSKWLESNDFLNSMERRTGT